MTQKQFFKKYVQPHLWEGWCWIEGGWGNKNLMLELTRDAREFKSPLYVMPTHDSVPASQHTETNQSEREINYRYHVALPGYNWSGLITLVTRLVTAGLKNQDWLLNSYVSTEPPNPAQQIYRLCIKVREGRVSYSIVEGEFRPSFVNNKVVARW